MENAYKETMFILNKYNISASKSLGQNFLINDEVIEKIVESANISNEDLIIEIGPGLGTLTKRLLEKAKKVIAIELDKRMISILQERFSLYDNFKLINDDILKVNLNEIIQNEKDIKEVKIVANLPYYITTPIIMKLLEDKLTLKSITVMVQKEVAKRLTSNPGSKQAGAITYAVNYYCEPEEIVLVPNSSFIPEPEVESEVIKLNLRNNPPVKIRSEEVFFKLIKASFMQRRKTLVNGITNSGLMSKEEIKTLLKKVNLPENVRGEVLTMQDFAKLTNEYISIT
ncbi:MAG: 16S rRNA (adenine(1518)-N(6)/adenine(1519)-N(6))-dimethyltransferase RsmA [Clostridia bacterium]|nr:16S rRNA (adenine(1518)-N(6)/adenine(1519)-N(6))-dimethyltransferase RsmA [Clostridia bacterium]